MPNWCGNRLTIYHHDKFDIGRVLGKFNHSLDDEREVWDFDKIIPVPQELISKEESNDEFGVIEGDEELIMKDQTDTGYEYARFDVDDHTNRRGYVCGDMIGAHLNSDEYLMEKYNVISAYDYRCLHWGTKWIGSELKWTFNKHVLDIYFWTAWAPPIPLINTIIGNIPNDYQFVAYEPGCELLYAQYPEEIIDVPGGLEQLNECELGILKEIDPETAEEYYEAKDGMYIRQYEDEDE